MIDDTPPRAKRAMCHRCERALRNCLCGLVRQIDNQIETLILQDQTEATNAKNTAGLLHLSLKNSRLFRCDADEAITEPTLMALLFNGQKLPLLLYPPTPDANSLGLMQPASSPANRQMPLSELRLVIIDATWRKSRKMLYLNPLLQRLARVTLENTPASLYFIRKADAKNQLSTLEASCYALQQLEQGYVNYSPLLTAMQEFVARQNAFRPAPSADKREINDPSRF